MYVSILTLLMSLGPNRAVKNAAEYHNIDERLLLSVCKVESNLDPHAYVYRDGGRRNHAVGLCQVLVKTASEYVPTKGCGADFRTKERHPTNCILFNPGINAMVAAGYLRKQLDRYPNSVAKAVAAYNAGHVKYRQKRLLNQKYVDRVFKTYKELADNN